MRIEYELGLMQKAYITQNFIEHSQHIRVEKILETEYKRVNDILGVFSFLTYISFEKSLSEVN